MRWHDKRQTKLVKKASEDSGEVYGYRKNLDDLIDKGEAISKNSVARLARLAGFQAQIGYTKKPGVFGGKPSVVADNTLDCRFAVDTPVIRTSSTGGVDGDLAEKPQAQPADPF